MISNEINNNSDLRQDIIKTGNIPNNFRIENVISRELKITIGSSETKLSCPFCKDQKFHFCIVQKLNIFKCHRCGFGGNPEIFIQHYYHLSPLNAFKYLVMTNPDTLKKSIYSGDLTCYVLKLEPDSIGNFFYYVGITNNLEARFAKHREGVGAEFTKLHKPIEIIETFVDVNIQFENQYTLFMMSRYGHFFVRGGNHAFPEQKYFEYEAEINNETDEGIFVLELDQNKYYIGFSVNKTRDIKKFLSFKKDNEWTRQFKPIKLVKTESTRDVLRTRDYVLEYINRYGWDNVRGFRWSNINIREPKDLSD